MIFIENFLIENSSYIQEKVNKDYFAKEGKGIFAYFLQEYLGRGNIILFIQPSDFENTYGDYFDILHVAVKVGADYFDINGKQTLREMMSNQKLGVDDFIEKPIIRKELLEKYMGAGKPLDGIKNMEYTKNVVYQLIQEIPSIVEYHDSREKLLK